MSCQIQLLCESWESELRQALGLLDTDWTDRAVSSSLSERMDGDGEDDATSSLPRFFQTGLVTKDLFRAWEIFENPF